MITRSKLEDVDFMRKLVKRVMNDGGMTRLEACNFVKTMFHDTTGFDVLFAIDEGMRRSRESAGSATLHKE